MESLFIKYKSQYQKNKLALMMVLWSRVTYCMRQCKAIFFVEQKGFECPHWGKLAQIVEAVTEKAQEEMPQYIMTVQ